jgi:hypothetical protein
MAVHLAGRKVMSPHPVIVADLQGRLEDDFARGPGAALAVLHVPAESVEDGIITRAIPVEALDQVAD